jgi:hypothetical protein
MQRSSTCRRRPDGNGERANMTALATPSLRFWGDGGEGTYPDLILIRYRGLSAVPTGVSPGRVRASGAKGCVLSDVVQAGQASLNSYLPFGLASLAA